MKKRPEATQTLRAGCSKAEPQTNKHTNRQGRLQYTGAGQLSAQCIVCPMVSIHSVMCEPKLVFFHFSDIRTVLSMPTAEWSADYPIVCRKIN